MKKIYIILLITAIFFTSCSTNKDSITETNENSTNKITIGTYFSGDRNPLAITSSYNEPINLIIYDSLYTLNEKLEPIGNLAKEITIENGGRDATITIEPNVKFHDGSMLTANDISATINHILTNGGYYAYNVRNITNVTIVNNHSIRLRLTDNAPNIKMQLTFPIVSGKSLLQSRNNDDNFELNGTGSYKISSETKGKQIILIRNPDYHSNFQSNIKEIEINLIPDKMTTQSLSGSGILDVFYAPFYDEGLKTVTKSETKKTDYGTDEYTFIKFNNDSSLLNIKQLRKAISFAVDREKITQDIYISHADAAFFPMPPSSWAYNKNDSLQRDVNAAKKLFEELSWQDNDNDGITEAIIDDAERSLKLRMLTSDTPIKQSLSKMLIENLKDIGVNLEVTTVSESEFKRIYPNSTYDLYLVTTSIGYDLDLYEFLAEDGKFFFPAEIDFAGYQEKLRSTDKKEHKQPTYAKICDDFYENMPHIPLLFLKNTMITSDKLTNIGNIFPIDLYYNLLRSNVNEKN